MHKMAIICGLLGFATAPNAIAEDYSDRIQTAVTVPSKPIAGSVRYNFNNTPGHEDRCSALIQVIDHNDNHLKLELFGGDLGVIHFAISTRSGDRWLSDNVSDFSITTSSSVSTTSLPSVEPKDKQGWRSIKSLSIDGGRKVLALMRDISKEGWKYKYKSATRRSLVSVIVDVPAKDQKLDWLCASP